MVVFSCFDGISCGRVALERAGIKVDRYYASEIDKYAIEISKANYPGIIQVGDITKIKYEDGYLKTEVGDFYEPTIDLMLAGSPCQGFSSSGYGLNFNDPRSKLFFDFIRLKEQINPEFFLLENVRMKKEWLNIISKHIGVQPIFINSSLFSAQNRPRYYWLNWKITEPTQDKGVLLKDILDYNAPEKYYLSEVAIQHIQTIVDRAKEKGLGYKDVTVYPPYDEKSKAVDANYHKGQDGKRTMIGLNFVGGIENGRRLNDGKNLSRNFREGYRIYDEEGKAATLTSQSEGGPGKQTGLYAVGWNRKEGFKKFLYKSYPVNATDYKGVNRNQTTNAVIKDKLIRKLTPPRM